MVRYTICKFDSYRYDQQTKRLTKMAINVLPVCIETRELARLASKQYSKNYTNVDNSKLPKALKTNLGIVYKALFDTEIPEDDYTYTVRAVDGIFSRLYGPSLGIFPDETEPFAAIKWGEKFYKLNEKDLKLNIGVYNFTGRGDDECLYVTVREGKETYKLPVSIKSIWDDTTNEYQDIDVAEVEAAIDEGTSLVGLIGTHYVYNGGDGEQKNTQSFGVNDLPEGVYTVTSFEAKSTSWGENYLMTFSPAATSVLGLDEGVTAQCWSNKMLRFEFEMQPTMPATLEVLSDRRGKKIARLHCESYANAVDDNFSDFDF